MTAARQAVKSNPAHSPLVTGPTPATASVTRCSLPGPGPTATNGRSPKCLIHQGGEDDQDCHRPDNPQENAPHTGIVLPVASIAL